MNEKVKYFLGFGIGLWLITVIIQNIMIATCKGGLGCLDVLIFALPGVIVSNLFGLGLVGIRVTNIIFYFIIGGLIGLIVLKMKK